MSHGTVASPDKFVLKPKDKCVLGTELVAGRHTPLKVARRAQILLSRSGLNSNALVRLGR